MYFLYLRNLYFFQTVFESQTTKKSKDTEAIMKEKRYGIIVFKKAHNADADFG